MTMKTPLILAATALTFAGTAHAGTYDKKADMKTTAPAATIIQADNSQITMIANEQFAVLGVVERDGQTFYQIPGTTGQVFYNHIPVDLTDVTTDVDVLDEYTYEYNGMTFTNRIVRDDADSVG